MGKGPHAMFGFEESAWFISPKVKHSEDVKNISWGKLALVTMCQVKLLLEAPSSDSADNLSQAAEVMLQAQSHLAVNHPVAQKPSPSF